MATASDKGQHVRLEFNVWYDKGSKRIHLTSNDPDLPTEGIHTDLKPGTAADLRARALLAKFGKLPPDA